jgi:hypothetical protein
MHFDEYKRRALETAQYPCVGNNLIYPAMGLAGEAGEYCDSPVVSHRLGGHQPSEV